MSRPKSPSPRALLGPFRRRFVRERWGRDCRNGLEVAIGVFVFVEGARVLVVPAMSQQATSTETSLIVAIGLYALAFLVATVRALLFGPDLQAVARRVDKRFGLKQEVATALEFDGSAARAAGTRLAVLHALQLDAAAKVAGVMPSSLIAPVSRRRVWGLAAMATCAIALATLPLDSLVAGGKDTRPSTFDLDMRATSDPESLSDLATAVSEASRGAENEYLEAIVRELDELSDDVTEAGRFTENQRARARQLASHLTRVLHDMPSVASSLADRLGVSNESIVSELQQLPDGSNADAAQARLPPDEPGSIADDGRDGSASPPQETQGESRADGADPPGPAAGAETAEGSQQRIAGDPSEQISEYGERDPSIEALRQDLARLDAQFGVPIGQGEGERAGAFPQAPDGGERDLFERSDGFVDDVALPVDERASRRIEVMAAPDSNVVDVSGSSVTSGAWRTSDEAVIRTSSVSHEVRAVASRYFLPDQANPRAEPKAP